MGLGLGTSLVKGGMAGRQYIKDGLKLYMPYKGADTTKGVQFVGTGSTSFDGNDYVDTGATFKTTFDGSFTISAWIKPTDGNPSADEIFIGTNNADDTDAMWFYVRDGGELGFWYEANNNSDLTLTADDMFTDGANDWCHVCAVVDDTASQVSLYYNGESKTLSGSYDGDISAITNSDFQSSGSTPNLFIGARSDNGTADSEFTGSIKNVAIWNRALTATEVQNVMYKTYEEVSGRLASGLVSWWALDSSTDTYKDSHGSNDGTNSGSTLQDDIYGGYSPVIPRAIDNAPTVQADAIGSGSARFDGSSYIHVGDTGATANAICMWFKPDTAVTNSTGYGFLMSLNGVSSYHGIALGPFTGGFTDEIISIIDDDEHMSGYLSSSYSISTDWHHLALSYNGTSPSGYWDIYLDGVALLPITEYSTSEAIDVDYLQFGRRSDGGGYFTGNICQAGIWSASLTQAQIQSIMEKTYEELTASEKTNLVSYWALDETTLGSELVTNGDFSTGDFTDWTVGNGWSVIGGVATFAYTDEGNSKLIQGIGLADNKTYKLTFDYTCTSGSLTVRVYDGGYVTLGTYSSSSDSVELDFLNSGNDGRIFFTAVSTTFAGTIDNVSVKEVQVEDKQGSNNGSLI